MANIIRVNPTMNKKKATTSNTNDDDFFPIRPKRFEFHNLAPMFFDNKGAGPGRWLNKYTKPPGTLTSA